MVDVTRIKVNHPRNSKLGLDDLDARRFDPGVHQANDKRPGQKVAFFTRKSSEGVEYPLSWISPSRLPLTSEGVSSSSFPRNMIRIGEVDRVRRFLRGEGHSFVCFRLSRIRSVDGKQTVEGIR